MFHNQTHRSGVTYSAVFFCSVPTNVHGDGKTNENAEQQVIIVEHGPRCNKRECNER